MGILSNALIIIGVMLALLISFGLIVFWASNVRNRSKSKKSMPSFGTDRSDFAKDMQSKYRNESRPTNGEPK